MDIKQLNSDTETIKSDEHMVNLKSLVDIEINEKYKFIPSKIRRFFNFLLKCFAFPIFRVIHFFSFNFKTKGKENLKILRKKKQNFIQICNHCLFLDSAMAIMNTFKNTLFTPTVEVTLRMKYLRHIIASFNVIPIPASSKGLVAFKNAVNKILSNGDNLLIFPEGALWPYYPDLREFKTGAFRFAVDNNTPILPSCITFRKRTGLWKFLGKKPLVTMTFLPPIYPNISSNKKLSIKELQQASFDTMKTFINKHQWHNQEYDKYQISDDNANNVSTA